jgi:hypothetical protein
MMTNTQVRRVMGSKSFRESAVAKTNSQTMTQTLTTTATSAGMSNLGVMGCYMAVQRVRSATVPVSAAPAATR